jgi:hypothetical protein
LIDVISGQQEKTLADDNPEEQENLPQCGYSLKQFTAFAEGDPEGLQQILDSFIRSGKQNAKLFRIYLQERNHDAISELSHKMLTLFRQLEAFEIVELLSRLEQKDFILIGDNHFYLLGKAVLKKIDALLQILQEEVNMTVSYSETSC